MSLLFNQVITWLSQRTWIVWTLVILQTAVAIGGYLSPGIFKSQGSKWSRDEDRQRATARDRNLPAEESEQERFQLYGDAVIVCESDLFFSPRGAESIRNVVAELESLPQVDRVQWLDRVPMLNIFGLPEPVYPPSDYSLGLFAGAKDKALMHPLIKGVFLSADGRTQLLMVDFNFLYVRNNADCMERLRETAESAAAKFPDVPINFWVTGKLPTILTAIESRDSNQIKYQVIGYGMILLMSVLLFRGVVSVLIVALAPCVGVFWTLGVIRYFGFQDSPFNDVILPVMISLVGFTDGVHLLVQIRNNRAAGMAPADAAYRGIRQVGLACALTSITTAIGFGSLGLAHHQIVREFGYACVIGVILTFVAVIVLVPLACASPLGRWLHVGHGKSVVDQNLGRIHLVVDLVLRRRLLFSALGIFITLGLIAVATGLRPDERTANSLPINSEAAIALRKMDLAMGGLETSAVEISWGTEVRDDNPEILQVVRKIDSILDQETLIGSPLSITRLLDALPGEGADADRFSMLELLPPPLKRAFLDSEKNQAVVNFRCQDLGIAQYGSVFERIEAGLKEIMLTHPEFQLRLEGNAVWRWRNLYQIVVDLAASLGSAAVIIFFVLSIAFRSLWIGLISIVPNLFPLALAATYLVISGQSLEIVSVCAFTVCLGIAVDDTIHFLTRYREESEHCGDINKNISAAFSAVGTALIMTTLVLVAGFGTVIFSDSRDHHIFASMGAITVGSALVGDLLFLPAMLAAFDRRR